MGSKLLGSFDQNKRKCCYCDEYFDKDDYKNYKWDEKLVSVYHIDHFYERYHNRVDTLFHKRPIYCPNCFEKKYELDLEAKAKSVLDKAPLWLKIDD